MSKEEMSKQESEEFSRLAKLVVGQGYSEKEVNEEVAGKMKEFAPSLTKLGAITIIAKELCLIKDQKGSAKTVAEKPKKKEHKEEEESEDEESEEEPGEEPIEEPVIASDKVEEMDLDNWLETYTYHKFLSLTSASDEEYAILIIGDKVKSRPSQFKDDEGNSKNTETIHVRVLDPTTKIAEDRDLTLRRKFGSILKDFLKENGKAMPFKVKKKGTGKETSYSIKAAPEAVEDMKKAVKKKDK